MASKIDTPMEEDDTPYSENTSPEFDDSSSEDEEEPFITEENTISKFMKVAPHLVLKPDNNEERAADFDVDEFLKPSNDKSSGIVQNSGDAAVNPTSDLMKSSDHSTIVETIVIGNNIYPLQHVPNSYPVSCVRGMNFSWRYLYRNVLTSEADCVQWLATHGLLRNEQTCKTCSDTMILVKEQTHWRCRTCKVDHSIRQDSFFKEKRLPLTTMLELLYWWTLDPMPSLVASELDVNRATVTTWFQFFRRICEQYFEDHPMQLGGPGKEVEIDKYEFTPERSNFSYRILGIVERESNNVFLTVLTGRSVRLRLDIIEQVVQSETKIFSPASEAFREQSQRSDLHYFGPYDPGYHTEGLSGLWHCLKNDFRSKETVKTWERKLKEIQFRWLMGDAAFGELLYWLDFYRW